MKFSTSTSLVVLAVASSASAGILHVVPGEVEARNVHPISHVNGHGSLHRRAPTNEAEMAALKGKTQCNAINVPDTSQMVQQKEYPAASTIASIVKTDTQAKKVWQDIRNSGIVPSNVQVKPSTNNDNVSPDTSKYNSGQDPDCWWTASTCKTPKAKGLAKTPDIYSCPEASTWGLTFDDGPNCTHNAFYDFLEQNKLKATMFYIGTNVINLPYQAQRGLADGHDICGHTWSHHAMTTLSNEQVFAELYYTSKVIKQVIGVTPTCWRPPFGDVDDRVRAIAYGLGLRTILWQEDTDDWNIVPAGSAPTQKIDQNYQNIINKASSESPIVLNHELTKQTMNEFQKQFPNMQKAYKHVVPITACQNISKPYADSDISYPGFSDFVSGNVNPSGLPDGTSMKIDPSATFTPVALNKQTNGFAHPQSGSSSSGGSSKFSSASNTTGTTGSSAASGNNAAGASASSSPNSKEKMSSGAGSNAPIIASAYAVLLATLVSVATCV